MIFELYTQRSIFMKRHGYVPSYLVVDKETYLELEYVYNISRTIGKISLYGMEIVVIPTDGIKMMKMVGSPYEESRRQHEIR